MKRHRTARLAKAGKACVDRKESAGTNATTAQAASGADFLINGNQCDSKPTTPRTMANGNAGAICTDANANAYLRQLWESEAPLAVLAYHAGVDASAEMDGQSDRFQSAG